jgi:1,4-dihydroxy-2-naphthoate octaprenyltransferase
VNQSINGVKIWFMALRPKTLTAAFSPVMIASAMAFAADKSNGWIMLVSLLTILLLQIGTNIANDYYDFIKGADTADRIGPTRVTQAGLLPPARVKQAFILCFSLATVGWAILTLHAGWLMAVLGIASILTGIYYTAGAKALGYVGLGDVFVFIFFGPVGVAACYYVQALEVNLTVFLAGIGPGLLAVAILTVNNLRDVDSDRRAGKRTLAVRFGRRFARIEYALMIAGAALMPLLIYLQSGAKNPWLWLSTLTCLAALPLLKTVFDPNAGAALNRTLAQTGAVLLGYSVVFSAAWVWG